MSEDKEFAALIGRVEGVCGGRPTILGTRIEPHHLSPYLRGGWVRGVLEDFPHLTEAQVRAAFWYLENERANS